MEKHVLEKLFRDVDYDVRNVQAYHPQKVVLQYCWLDGDVIANLKFVSEEV